MTDFMAYGTKYKPGQVVREPRMRFHIDKKRTSAAVTILVVGATAIWLMTRKRDR